MASGNLEFSGISVDIQNVDVRITEHTSTSDAPGGPVFPNTSNNLIQSDQAWDVWFRWDQVAGSYLLNGGQWKYEVFLELMGPGEATVGGYHVKTTPTSPTNGTKTQYIHINQGVVPPGTYRVVANVQFFSLGEPRALAMFADVGMIKIYEEEV